MSSKPNLQNISPPLGGDQKELATKLKEAFQVKMMPGSADYSQHELKIMGELLFSAAKAEELFSMDELEEYTTKKHKWETHREEVKNAARRANEAKDIYGNS